MKNVNRKWDVLSDEQRNIRIKEIISFFKIERTEEIGLIAAGELLDFILRTVGKDVYGKAIVDAKKLLDERFKDMEVDLDILQNRS